MAALKDFYNEDFQDIDQKVQEIFATLQNKRVAEPCEDVNHEHEVKLGADLLRKKFEEEILSLKRSLNEKFKELKNKLKGKPYVKKNSLEELAKKIGIAQLDVMRPAFTILGPSVVHADLSAQGLADLMYQKQVTSDEFHQIISSLARWHMLDELQQYVKPLDFSRCFADFNDHSSLGGRPVEDLYEGVDKHRLHQTLEALHKEKYQLSVTEGWSKSKECTRHFLLAFILSLFKNPLVALYGKMSAFHRFFTEVCGYTFIRTAKTLQNWFRHYFDFDRERHSRAVDKPKNESQRARTSWLRKLREYTHVEELATWMQSRFPHYGVSMA